MNSKPFEKTMFNNTKWDEVLVCMKDTPGENFVGEIVQNEATTFSTNEGHLCLAQSGCSAKVCQKVRKLFPM